SPSGQGQPSYNICRTKTLGVVNSMKPQFGCQLKGNFGDSIQWHLLKAKIVVKLLLLLTPLTYIHVGNPGLDRSVGPPGFIGRWIAARRPQ
ncbi:MAG: hypothetical protein DRR15_14105, partial [Gammaproteobacteria bacterium]